MSADPVKARRHRGDIMTPEKRSALMSRIRGRDTAPELAVAGALRSYRFRFETQARDLPGRPDFVFRRVRVVVFVDGDFWHGWKFEQWRDKLSEKWEEKIEANRRRDTRNAGLLAETGWTVVRLWEHEVRADSAACAARIVAAVRANGGGRRVRRVKTASFSVQPGSMAE